MSRTIIHQQCRSLPRVLTSSPSIYHEHSTQSYYTSPGTWSSRSCRSTRFVHTARIHPQHDHSSRPISRQDGEHELLKTKELKDDLRLLLRDIAQPVAVVTSFMPANGSADAGSSAHAASGGSTSPASSPPPDAVEASGTQHDSKFHGATLSSFTSIAMDPYPLVAFALRIPSRMATTLSSLAPCMPSSTSSIPPQRKSQSSLSSHMVINLLSASQAAAAITFSRPDLYPTPFVSGSHSKKQEYSLSKDGLPILHGVVGALSCRLVGGSIPLHDLDYFGSGFGAKAKELTLGQGGVASELFIARVMRVERVQPLRDELETKDDEECERTLPLVYHRRGYTSCHPRPGRKKDKKT